ncbi:MAG: ParB/RepB/Spo0J family partition protein [bacterium]
MVNEEKKEKDFKAIPIDKIAPCKWNVRTSDKEKGIEELAESILKYGLLQPVVVFQEGDEFNLIIGQRRLRVFKELKKKDPNKFKDIPAIILSKKPDEESSKILSLSENIHRVELNRADIVEVISYLHKKHNKSAKEVAKILGKSIPYIYEHLKIQDAPEEIKQMLSNREIEKADVKRVMEIAADDKDKMIKLAKEIKGLAGPEKARLVEAGKHKPKAKAEELIEEAKKPRIEEKIIVPLTPALMVALDRAVKEIGLSREEIAKKALEDWLDNKGYYKE